MELLDKFMQDYPVDLTEKEKAVLRCLIDGDSDKVIARRTGIGINTVRTHIKQGLFSKLGVNNRTKVALWGWYHGFGKQEQEE